jgi:hypothetical protein
MASKGRGDSSVDEDLGWDFFAILNERTNGHSVWKEDDEDLNG